MWLVWHRLQHRFGWYSGHVVSRTTGDGRIMIGFMCSKCSKVMSEHDATNMIDRRIAKVVIGMQNPQ